MRFITLRLLAALSLSVAAAAADGQTLLETNAPSLTTSLLGSATPVQNLRPSVLHRGVNLDGTVRAPTSFQWYVGANPFPEDWNSNVRQGAVRLDVGAYEVDETDLSLQSRGIPWVIGRTYNPVQRDGSGRMDSNGYQGWNWAQSSQPEIVLVDDADDSKDLVYLVYGADRFLEFRRVITGGNPTASFRGVNGAAGAVIFEADANGPDTFTYHDQVGNRIVFFGFDGAAAPAQGQLWTMTDPAGAVAFVGSVSKSQAISAGYDAEGRITTAFDAEGRRYSYTYQTLDSVKRLTQVKAEVNSGSWTEVGRVDYTYYTSTDSDVANGSPGDLKLVATVTPLSGSSQSLRKVTYYRYWKGTYNSATNPGYAHQLRLVVGPEGNRKFDWNDSGQQPQKVFDDGFLGASYGSLNPYALAGLTAYEENTGRLKSAWFNGECGCSGGVNGTYGYAYADSATDPRQTPGYQNEWCTRTVVTPPVTSGTSAGAYAVQYFDEAGQPLSRVLTQGDPAQSPTKQWSFYVERDTDGMLARWHSPRNLRDDETSRYVHATGSFEPIADRGLVVRFQRVASGSLKGLLAARMWMEGDSSQNEYAEWSVTYTSASKAASADYSVLRPFVASRSQYTTTSPSSGVNTTDYVYAFHSGEAVLVPKSIETRLPVVSITTNGPGGTSRNTTIDYLRTDGTLAFRRERDGILTYTRVEGGQVSLQIDDANTNASDIASADNPGTVWGISSITSGTNLVTRYAYDAQGRGDTTILPSSRVTKLYYTKLDDSRGVTLSIPKWDSSSGSAYGPALYTVFNGENHEEFVATIGLPNNQTTASLATWVQSNPNSPIDDPIAALSTQIGSLERLTTSIRNNPGVRVEETRVYFDIPASGVGSQGTNYDRTKNDYDPMGRLFRVTQPSGTIVRSEFEPRGLAIKKYVGTNDPDGGSFGPGNMEIVWIGTYDGAGTEGGGGSSDGGGGTGEGDPSSSECYRIFEFLLPGPPNRIFRDARGRIIVVSRTAAPHVFYERDNLGRVTAVGLYDNVDELITADQQGRYPYESATYTPRTFNGQTSHRLALAEFGYDEQGRIFKRVRHNIGQVTGQDLGQDLDNLVSLTWYDAAGRIVKQRGERLAKYHYDRLGRSTHEFELAKDNDFTYADALDAAGDTVMTESQSIYDAATGNMLMSVKISRFHDDDSRLGDDDMTTGTGPLDLNQDGGSPTPVKLTAADVKGRAQIESRWYDVLDRLTTIAQYGTNGGSTFDRSGLAEPTTSSASVLVTKYAYDTAGSLSDVQNPMGRHTRTFYDDAGRTIKSVENYTDGTPGPNDQDRTTEYVYTNSLLTQQIARVHGGTDQVTTYTYGTATSGTNVSEVATGHLLTKVEYPDKADATDVVSMLYTRQGRVKRVTDQAGNVIAFDYDQAFRLAERRVTNFAADFDTSVNTIATSYNVMGQLQTVTQKDASAAVLNQVKFLYDGWGNVTKTQQDHDSTVGGTHLYDVAYSYAKAAVAGTRQTVRRTGMTLPDGTPVGFEYLVGTSNSVEIASILNDQLSRVRRVTVGSTPSPVAKYEYLGLDQLVGVEYPQPGVVSNRFGATFGQYPSLDAFDRPVVDAWTKSDAPDIWRENVTYDYNSNIDRVVDEVLSGHDVDFSTDGLDRLTKAEEGTWSGSAIASRTRQEIWTLTQTGNWSNHKLDKNGNNTFTDSGDLDETGTFNTVNEVTQRDLYSSGQQPKTPAHDRVGNMTDDGEVYKYVYDPFGRLTKVVSRANPSQVVAQYTHDGLGQLIAARSDTNSDGSVTDEPTERYAYDARWRIVAVYVTNSAGTSTVIKERYVRHNAGLDGLGGASYIDEIILRDRDVTGPTTLEERVYYCQNSHHDVSALVDAGGSVLERVKYWSYGMPRVYPRINADWDHNGVINEDDITAFMAGWESSSSECDVNGDGGVDGADIEEFDTAWQNGWTTKEDLSVVTGNRFGYTGHLWDKYTRKYHARHRVYDAAKGRFLNRDPLEYESGSVNLYEYGFSSPTKYADSLGLSPGPKSPPAPPPVPGTVPISPGSIPGAPLDPQVLGPGGIVTHPRHGNHPTGHSAFYVKDPSCPSGYRYGSQGTNGFTDGDLGDYIRGRDNDDTIIIDPIRDVNPHKGREEIKEMIKKNPDYRGNTKCNDIVCELVTNSTGGQFIPAGGKAATLRLSAKRRRGSTQVRRRFTRPGFGLPRRRRHRRRHRREVASPPQQTPRQLLHDLINRRSKRCAVKTTWKVHVWAMAVLTCGVAFGTAPKATDKESARSVSDLALICDAWRSPIGFEDKRQLLRAAASRDDFVKLAQAALGKPENDACLDVYIEIVSSRWGPDAVPTLKRLASDTTENRRLRLAAIGALKSFARPDYLPSMADDAAGRPDLDLQAKAVVDWLEKNAPPVIAAQIDKAALQIGSCIDKMSEKMGQDRSLDGHAFEGEYNCIQIEMYWLETSTDSGNAARHLVEHLKRLHSLPSSSPADELDKAIGLLQYQVLISLQNHVGPISGLEREQDERADIEPIAEDVLAWWPTAKGLSPTQWRMQRLRDRGYKTDTTEPGPSIGAELLRAVQSGTSAEAFAASTLLKSFDLCNGTVPYRDRWNDNEKKRINNALTDAFIRGLVASDAARRMIHGRFPAWDPESNAWIVKQAEE